MFGVFSYSIDESTEECVLVSAVQLYSVQEQRDTHVCAVIPYGG